MNFKYLVVEGPIGAGKTTLASKLAQAFHSELLLDQPWENPFLVDFYERRPGSAFKAQLYFLASRFAALKEVTRNFPKDKSVIADFLLEKDKVFAYLNLEDQEIEVYNRLYDAISDYLVTPDLVLYLKASVETLQERIKLRKMEMEARITPPYLHRLMEAFEHFFFQYHQRTRIPVLVVDSTQMDITSSSKSDLDDFVNFIRQKHLTGFQYYTPLAKG